MNIYSNSDLYLRTKFITSSDVCQRDEAGNFAEEATRFGVAANADTTGRASRRRKDACLERRVAGAFYS
jgi:hypothetical protein